MSAPPRIDTAPIDPEPSGGRERAWTPARAAGTAFGVLVCLAIIALYLVAPWDSAQPRAGADKPAAQIAWGRSSVGKQGLEQLTGVTITQVAVTGAGGLVDLRFEVLDPALATKIHDPSTPPAVIDERTGLVVHDLFMNHAHSGAFHAGETYYFIFINPRNWIHRGSKVTVLLGDTAVEHVVVQ